MKHQTVGHTIVRDIRVEVQPDAFGEDALFIVLVLSDPPAGHDSWPIDDLQAMRQGLRERIAPHLDELPLPWFVVFEPEHPDLEELEDENGQLGLDVDQ